MRLMGSHDALLRQNTTNAIVKFLQVEKGHVAPKIKLLTIIKIEDGEKFQRI